MRKAIGWADGEAARGEARDHDDFAQIEGRIDMHSDAHGGITGGGEKRGEHRDAPGGPEGDHERCQRQRDDRAAQQDFDQHIGLLDGDVEEAGELTLRH
jgi:hypothetical protein